MRIPMRRDTGRYVIVEGSANEIGERLVTQISRCDHLQSFDYHESVLKIDWRSRRSKGIERGSWQGQVIHYLTVVKFIPRVDTCSGTYFTVQ